MAMLVPSGAVNQGKKRFDLLTAPINDDSEEARTVYVYHCAEQVTENNLQTFFQYCGKLNGIVKRWDKTNNTFCFVVEFARPESARTACCLDGTQLLSQEIQILSDKFDVAELKRLANAQQNPQGAAATEEDKDPSKAGAGSGQLVLVPQVPAMDRDSVLKQLGYDPANPPPWLKLVDKGDETLMKTVYVGNLPIKTSSEKLRAHMSNCGPVNHGRVGGDPKKGFRWGIVEFQEVGGALAAVQLNGQIYRDRQLFVAQSANIMQRLDDEEEIKLDAEEKEQIGSEPDDDDEDQLLIKSSPDKPRGGQSRRDDSVSSDTSDDIPRRFRKWRRSRSNDRYDRRDRDRDRYRERRRDRDDRHDRERRERERERERRDRDRYDRRRGRY